MQYPEELKITEHHYKKLKIEVVCKANSAPILKKIKSSLEKATYKETGFDSTWIINKSFLLVFESYWLAAFSTKLFVCLAVFPY